MAKHSEPKDATKLLDEIKGQNDRAAIAVGGSFLEYALECAVGANLRAPTSKTEAGMLFSDRGIFGTFEQKIWGAFFIKLVGPKTRRDLDLIRTIRNEAAHSIDSISFEETPKICDRCKELYFPSITTLAKTRPLDIRMAFIGTVTYYSGLLLCVAAADSVKPNNEALTGLSKLLGH